MLKVKIQLLHPDAKIPFKTYEGDYCYDCVAVSEEEIAPNVWKYKLGFAIQNAEPLTDYFNAAFTLRPRSSIWKTGMVMSNSIGFELNKEYYDKACKRIKLEQAQLTLF